MTKRVLLSDAVDEHIQWMRDNDLSAGTVRVEGLTLKSFVKTLRRQDRGEDRALTYLRAEHVNRVFTEWRISPSTHIELSARTLNRKRDTLARFFRWCERRKYITNAADLTAEIRRRKGIDRRRIYLDVNDLMGLLDGAKHPRDRALAAMAMNTGLRQSEIVALRIKDVDLAGGWIDVQMFKNHKSDRLPITADLDAELRVWLREYAERCGELHPSWYLIPAKQPPSMESINYVNQEVVDWEDVANAPLRPTEPCKNASTVMRRMLERAGKYAPYEGMHTIRRSAARAFYEAFLESEDSRDEALAVTQALLNHEDPKMTAHYIGVERFRDKRDKVMRGKPVLSSRISESNVTPLREVVE